MNKEPISERIIHWSLSWFGGLIGAYAIGLRGGNFGSAQTGNLLELMIDFSMFSWLDVVLRIGALVVFAGALVLVTLMKHTRLPLRYIVLAAEGVGIIVTALIPAEADPVLALYPIFFISSMQWGVFFGNKKYNSATIFTTNNIRQTVESWTEYIITKDRSFKDKAVYYTCTVSSFLFGGLVGAFGILWFGVPAVFIGFLPLAVAASMCVCSQIYFRKLSEMQNRKQ